MKNAKLVQDLQKQINSYMNQDFSHIIILCVGTNKIIGDCIGPMVGQKLQTKLKEKKNHQKIIIYGNMEETLNFKNARQVIENIYKIYEKPLMITIDSALGTEKLIKRIVVNQGWIKIGNSLERSICYYSHINVKGIVGENKSNFKENIETLKNVRPGLVIGLANDVVEGLENIISKIGIVN